MGGPAHPKAMAPPGPGTLARGAGGVHGRCQPAPAGGVVEPQIQAAGSRDEVATTQHQAQAEQARAPPPPATKHRSEMSHEVILQPLGRALFDPFPEPFFPHRPR